MDVLGQESGRDWTLFHGDTVEVARGLPQHSADFICTSIPFGSLYVYSASPRDFGNVRNDVEFFEQYAYLLEQQARVMRPGRLVAVHLMNLPTSKVRDGHIGLRDFRGDVIRAHEKHGFIYHSEVCIWKCPVTAVTRTKAFGLLHKTIRSDSAMSRQGIADYLVVFRTPGENPQPISHTHETFPVERWQRYASPIWATLGEQDEEGFFKCSDTEVAGDDSSGIDATNTLQARSAREHADERHLAPLQLEVIRRAVILWTNPGDVVWDPFAGIGSTGVVAVQNGRRFLGAELKASYYRQAVANLQNACSERQTNLFDQAEGV